MCPGTGSPAARRKAPWWTPVSSQPQQHPRDPNGAWYTSGIRLGTPALTTAAWAGRDGRHRRPDRHVLASTRPRRAGRRTSRARYSWMRRWRRRSPGRPPTSWPLPAVPLGAARLIGAASACLAYVFPGCQMAGKLARSLQCGKLVPGGTSCRGTRRAVPPGPDVIDQEPLARDGADHPAVVLGEDPQAWSRSANRPPKVPCQMMRSLIPGAWAQSSGRYACAIA